MVHFWRHFCMCEPTCNLDMQAIILANFSQFFFFFFSFFFFYFLQEVRSYQIQSLLWKLQHYNLLWWMRACWHGYFDAAKNGKMLMPWVMIFYDNLVKFDCWQILAYGDCKVGCLWRLLHSTLSPMQFFKSWASSPVPSAKSLMQSFLSGPLNLLPCVGCQSRAWETTSDSLLAQWPANHNLVVYSSTINSCLETSGDNGGVGE